jgi:hypothetical protein
LYSYYLYYNHAKLTDYSNFTSGNSTNYYNSTNYEDYLNYTASNDVNNLSYINDSVLTLGMLNIYNENNFAFLLTPSIKFKLKNLGTNNYGVYFRMLAHTDC